MTSQLVKAFDRSRAHAVPPAPQIRPAPHRVLARRSLSIRAALEWAFADERASLDFAEDKGDNVRPGVSPVWVLMQRGALGCQIDGGGHSLPARDADIIASAVASLPQDLGGRSMAVRIAELARAGQAPDWGRDLRPRCLPKGWKNDNQYGRQAETETLGIVTVQGRNGRMVQHPVLCCPVTFTATADRIAAARKQYHDWCDALAHLALMLRRQGSLDRVAITCALPDFEPWRASAGVQRIG